MDISIIVPLYKGNKYINNLMKMFNDNLEANDFGRNYSVEVIFVNDYPDEPLQISGELLCSYKLVEYSANKGIHGARVAGIEMSSGKYITMLDQDDQVTETWLESQYCKLTRENGTYIVCNGWKSRFGALLNPDKMDTLNNVKYYIEKENLIYSPGQVMMKKSAIPTAWLHNQQQKNGCDDWMLWIMALKEGNQFIVNSDMLYFHTPSRSVDSIAINQMMDSKIESSEILSELGYITEQEKKLMNHQVVTDYQTYRFLELYRQTLLWHKLDQQGKKIENYLTDIGYHRIAIYGMGDIAEVLCDELQQSQIEYYGIDQSSVDFYKEYKIYRPEDEWPEAELAIVTVTSVSMQPVFELIRKKNINKIITFSQLLIYMSENVKF